TSINLSSRRASFDKHGGGVALNSLTTSARTTDGSSRQRLSINRCKGVRGAEGSAVAPPNSVSVGRRFARPGVYPRCLAQTSEPLTESILTAFPSASRVELCYGHSCKAQLERSFVATLSRVRRLLATTARLKP